MMRIKSLFTERNEKSINNDENDLLAVSEYYGVAPKKEKVKTHEALTRADTLDGYKVCKKNDLAINIMLAWKGALGISNYDGIISPSYSVFSPDINICPKYFHYLFRTDYYKGIFKIHSTGIIDSRLRLYPEKFLSLYAIVPPLFEQQKIALFLNEKTKEIDKAIEKTKETIELYKKYKQAVITEAVTKGLDPNAKTKYSGNPYIGKINKIWNVTKVTHLLDYSHPYPIGDGDHGSIKANDYVQNGIPFIRVQNLGWATKLNLKNCVYISYEQNKSINNSTLMPNDILFAKTGGTIGKTAIIPENVKIANTTSHVGKVTIDNKKHNPKFYYYVFSSKCVYDQFWAIASLKTTRPELSIEDIKGIILPVPSTKIDEDRISKYLDNVCAHIDKLIDCKFQMLHKYENYKKSLIYEYVTGKKEVE